MDAAKIIAKNISVLDELFGSIASGRYYDGLSHQLYYDAYDDSLYVITEASDNSWQQRDDGSLVRVLTVNGYCDIPQDERYDEETCDRNDFGWQEWLDDVENRLEALLVERGEQDL